MTGRRGRRLNDDERKLWRDVTRHIKPIRVEPAEGDEPPVEVEAVAPPAPASSAPVAAPRRPPPPVAPPALAPIEKKLRRKIARGSEPLDLRLDLHGMTQVQAHVSLTRFLYRAQAAGARTVLVITGKGIRGEGGERGVLRRQVPQWLGLPELRGIVLGFEDAHAGHGGEGAIYVRIRRPRGGEF